MYKALKKTKVIWIYMEALALYIGAPTVHWVLDDIPLTGHALRKA